MGNVHFTIISMDELSANVRYLRRFRYECVMSFTETWSTDRHTDESVRIDGFKLVRCNRDLTAAGEDSAGGVCAHVNHQYCYPNNVTIKRHKCTPNLEMFVVSIRPYCLPRVFSYTVEYSYQSSLFSKPV